MPSSYCTDIRLTHADIRLEHIEPARSAVVSCRANSPVLVVAKHKFVHTNPQHRVCHAVLEVENSVGQKVEDILQTCIVVVYSALKDKYATVAIAHCTVHLLGEFVSIGRRQNALSDNRAHDARYHAQLHDALNIGAAGRSEKLVLFFVVSR